MPLSIVILAAGQGKRMRSNTPKVLHAIGGTPMLERVVNVATGFAPDSIYVVHGFGGDLLKQRLNHLAVEWVEQTEQLGTGHAVSQALPWIPDDHQVLVLYGDVPLITRSTLHELLMAAPLDGLGLVTAEVNNPRGLGRILRDKKDRIKAIVEEKDASRQQKLIKEINSGIIYAPSYHLKRWLPRLHADNQQGEYYLTDVVSMAVADGVHIETVMPERQEEIMGVNDRAQLMHLERYFQTRVANRLMESGVTVMDPKRFDLRGDIEVGSDTTIDINVIIEGRVKLGSRVHIGPNVVLRNATIGDDTTILANSIVDEAKIGEHCSVGPFARIRPGTELADKVKVGNFVEIKKSKLAEGSKANHLSYIGDATIGQQVNIGAGTITCNYDGVNKYQTVIEDGVFIGSNTALIAPVTVGAGATVGAGSTINKDVPAEQLTLARSKQVTIPGWQKPKKKD